MTTKYDEQNALEQLEKELHFICFCTAEMIDPLRQPFAVYTLSGVFEGAAAHSCTVMTRVNENGRDDYMLIIDEKIMLQFTKIGTTYEVFMMDKSILEGDHYEWYCQLVVAVENALEKKGQGDKMKLYTSTNNKAIRFRNGVVNFIPC